MEFNLIAFKQQLEDHYQGSGYNKEDTLKWLYSLKIWQGWDRSYDESLVVFHHKQFVLIAGSCGDQTIVENNPLR